MPDSSFILEGFTEDYLVVTVSMREKSVFLSLLNPLMPGGNKKVTHT